MLWRINAFEYNQNQGTLTGDAGVVILEPKANALLAYFCQHTNVDISRDKLLQDVWHGQLVSDNAINRVIVQLRKAFGDENSPREYIATIPKVGYRFIAAVQKLPDAVPENSETFTAATQSRSSRVPIIGAIGLALIMAVGGFFLYSLSSNDGDHASPNITPVTRLSAWQFDADISPDQNWLSYSVDGDGDNDTLLYLTEVASPSPRVISKRGGHAHSGRFTNDGANLVYQYHSGDDVCEFLQYDLTSDGATEPRLLQNCLVGSETLFAFSPDDQIMYFVERKHDYAPYEAFAFDIEQQNKWRLSQPVPIGRGNAEFDVHPNDGKILLVSDQKPGISSIFILDTVENAFEKVMEFDYDLSSAIWGHASNTIVHPGRHPSYDLVETNYLTGESVTLITDSRRITNPGRINNGKDYLFNSYLYNRDIEVIGNPDDALNSTVMDYLPSLSNSGGQLAFVSKRSGYSKVWLKDIQRDLLISIEPDNLGRTFYSLSWSFDDKFILANTSRGLVIFDVEQQQVSNTIESMAPIYAAYWSDQNIISFTQRVENGWQIYQTDSSGDLMEPLDTEYAFLLSDGSHTFYLDQELNLVSATGEPLTAEGKAKCGYLMGRYALNIQIDGDYLYCISEEEPDSLLSWHPESGFQAVQEKSDQVAYVSDYSIRGETVVITATASFSSDIMRTNF